MDASIYEKVKKMKEYALKYNVPIMLDDGIDFLTTFLIKHQISSVLELGTAIGYSAIMMALVCPKLKITSIERDRERYLEAVKNVKEFGLEDRITLIFSDAIDVQLEEKFDLIFLDAAKGQNINFFQHFEHNLNHHGFFLTDNMSFHGLVEKDESEISSKNLRALIRKIKNYITFLQDNPHYHTSFYSTGDGIAVSEKMGE